MKILIATDGSKFGDAAVEKVCRMIENTEDVNVKVISAYEQPVMVAAAPYGVFPATNSALEKQMNEFATSAVAQAEQKITGSFPALKNKLSSRVLGGSPAQAIIEEAENWGADLIVVGSHGYGFWERMFIGSVSNSIVNHAPCSVMVVRTKQSDNGKSSQ